MEKPGFTAEITRDSVIAEQADIRSLGHRILLRNDEVQDILHDVALAERRRSPRRSRKNR